MAYNLVGSLGAVVQSASGAAISGLAYGQTPTKNNLLITWWLGLGATTLPSVPTGWTAAVTRQGTSCAAAIAYRISVSGNDAVPAYGAITSSVQTVQLGEFSGNSLTDIRSAVNPPRDVTGVGSGTGASTSIAAGQPDLVGGELLIYCTGALYSVAGAVTLSSALNNGAASHDTTNNATSTVDHYCFGYGITTSNASNDTDTFAHTSSNITGAVGCISSFLLPTITIPTTVAQAVNRSTTY